MLTAETKRHIDSARQVLVGKVPDPKAQIDQITNALIYKFMDDMDVRSIDAGGKASFFVGELEQYSWRKLMDPRKGSQERLNIYTEALEKFSTAASLPQLFRDIFRQAFLPYRDPETLNLFLKEIEYFDYNHSEELGNAFEYLLSIMGSQGDAGQFRTPRHIIDFIVDILDPNKDDTILDPACGTAGFLISAYNHIIKKHDGMAEDGKKANEQPLTHQEKQKLMDNLEGYDISSDMVKLARVNMYLHGNKNPKIFEYDSLTSEERWDDNFDVIMANPPFMSPKGGIRPHKKFGVESSRAEVLFVDYIMTHLKQNGRAGIIVPEGIIFQSGSAYKQLRKMLIDNGLWCVISLPAGVFNPYSGVKTSILIIDKELAKKFNHIMFINVQSDGFDLGANRRPILQNDLHNAFVVISEAKKQIMNGQIRPGMYFPFEDPEHTISIAPLTYSFEMIDRIREEPDSTFQSNRYRAAETNQEQKWPMDELGEIAEVARGTSITSRDIRDGEVPVVAGGQSPAYYHNQSNRTPPIITVSGSGAYAGFVNYFNLPIFVSDACSIQSKNEDKVLTRFLYWVLKARQEDIYKLRSGMAQPHVYAKDLVRFQIPLPPIEVQKQIVEDLNGYQKIIGGAHQVIENYKPSIKIDSSWPIIKLETVTELIQRGKSPSYGDSEVQVIKSGQARGYYDFDFSNKYTVTSDFKLDHRRLQPRDLLINSTGVGTAGRVTLFNEQGDWLVDSHITIIRLKNDLANPDYILYALAGTYGFDGLEKLATGSGGQIELGLATIKNLAVAMPDLAEQSKIVDELSNERSMVDANRKLIKIYEQKIKNKITEVWGE